MNSFFSLEAWRGYCIYNVSFPNFPNYSHLKVECAMHAVHLGLDLVSFSAAEQGESTAAAAECEGGGKNCSGADMSIYMG